VATIPLANNPNTGTGLEILRGIAQAQEEINSQGKINGAYLKVGIANDDDKPEISKEIASHLVKNPEVSCCAFNLYKWNRHLACYTRVQNIRIIQFSCVTAY
jgi:hypothetical protein